jgi:hypothetical protein
MTAAEFRELALSLAGVMEGAHMGNADFRANRRIFATLGYPDNDWGMVNLPPSEQQTLIQAHPHIFEKAKGAWGLKGSTLVRLEKAHPDLIRRALDLSWQANAALKAPRKRALRST